MTKREKEQYLSQYKRLDRQIDLKLSQCEMWRARATKITPEYTDAPTVQSGTNRIETAIERICELEQEINIDIEVLIALKKVIETVINSVSDGVLRDVLEYRYIEGLTFERIAERMSYSYQWTCELHSRALTEFEIKHNT